MVAPADLVQTQNFINYRPSTITLKRRPKTSTPDGGWKFGAERDIGDVIVRITEMLRVEGRSKRLSSSGNLVVPSHIAVSMPDIDVKRYDTFEYEDDNWEVVWVSKLPEWRYQLELVTSG